MPSVNNLKKNIFVDNNLFRTYVIKTYGEFVQQAGETSTSAALPLKTET